MELAISAPLAAAHPAQIPGRSDRGFSVPVALVALVVLLVCRADPTGLYGSGVAGLCVRALKGDSKGGGWPPQAAIEGAAA